MASASQAAPIDADAPPPKRRLSFVARPSGVLRYRTPVGDYDVTMPDGSVERITLTKFQDVSAGI